MADENRIDHDPEDLENLSPEELQERIQEDKKKAKRSLRFAFTALIAIIAVCIAWFVANNQVTMNSTQITAETTEPFEIASVGYRLRAEEDYLIDNSKKNILSEGIERQTYDRYIDIETGKSTDSSLKYYVGGSGIAWHMNNDQNLVPGAGGKLEFYIIPKQSGLTSVTITLNMEGYKLNEETKKAEKLDNSKIQSLLNGHILLFRHLDDKYGYYDWLGADHTLTIDAPKKENEDEAATFVPNIPYKVTLYWKWPQYFRNYIYTQRSTYGDLFTDDMINNDNYKKDYESIIDFVNKQRIVTDDSSKLFYAANESGTETSPQITISETIDKNMSDTVLDTCSKYYNQADEYIGKNTQFVYIQIKLG